MFLYLEHLGISIEAKSPHDFQPIHYAAIGGATEVASYLCTQKSLSIYSNPNESGLTAVYLATVSSSPAILTLLADAGACLNDAPHLVRRFSPIQAAIYNKDSECLSILMSRGASLNRTMRDYSPLMMAIASKKIDAVNLLLEGGANPNYTTQSGKNALYLACYMKNAEAVRLLIDYGVNVKDVFFQGVCLCFIKELFIGLLVRRTLKS